MKKTFVCDETMIITIPIGSLKDRGGGQLMPEKFHCVYKDSYKVFTTNGKPKPLGAAQAIAGVFILTLGLIFSREDPGIMIYTLPSVVYVVSGMLSYAAGRSPNMHVLLTGIQCLIMTLLLVEKFIAVFLIYWLSKAVCRQHFNTLPMVLLKQGD
ncbi:uncharacterized protein LKV04_007859 [Tautogolabrus adspersus]